VSRDASSPDFAARPSDAPADSTRAGPVLGPRFLEAVAFALESHTHQRRKGSNAPYLAHPLAVAAEVLEHGADEDEAIAALLHDVIEDAGGAKLREQLQRRFGRRVAEIVDECSDTDQNPKPPWKPPWKERKAAFIARLPAVSASARLIIAADKLHNARSLLREYARVGEEVWKYFRGGREGTLRYYRSACEALKAAGGGPLVAELDRVVAELEQVAAGKAQG